MSLTDLRVEASIPNRSCCTESAAVPSIKRRLLFPFGSAQQTRFGDDLAAWEALVAHGGKGR